LPFGCGGSDGGGGSVSPASTGSALAQSFAGDTPVIRIVNIMLRPIPDPDTEIQGYIIFRGESPYVDTSTPYAIVHVSGDSHFAAWDDDMTSRGGIVAQKQWTYLDRNGQQQTASYQITYNHPPLVPGHTYYYRMRRIVSPYEPNVPISQQVPLAQPNQAGWPTPQWQFQPSDSAVLSASSGPIGPITYMLPAVLRQPQDGLSTLNPTSITFSWDYGTPPSAGPGAANARYVLLVYEASSQRLVYQSEPRSPLGSSDSLTVNDPNGWVFRPNTWYEWVVGLYVEGEPRPRTSTGLILSQRWRFYTVSMPPSP